MFNLKGLIIINILKFGIIIYIDLFMMFMYQYFYIMVRLVYFYDFIIYWYDLIDYCNGHFINVFIIFLFDCEILNMSKVLEDDVFIMLYKSIIYVINIFFIIYVCVIFIL